MDLWLSVLCMRSKAWLAARVSLAQLRQSFSRTLRSQKYYFLWVQILGTRRYIARATLLERADSDASQCRVLGVLNLLSIRKPECALALEGLALPRASHSGEIALSGSRRLRSTQRKSFSRTLLSQHPDVRSFSTPIMCSLRLCVCFCLARLCPPIRWRR